MVVPVPKKDGKVRLCGDYKVTVSQCLDIDQYPIPKPDDLFATLPTGKFFSKLDLSQAYQQMLVSEESAKYIPDNQYTPWKQQPASWSSFGPCYLPEGHGSDLAGHARSDMLYRQYPGDWVDTG